MMTLSPPYYTIEGVVVAPDYDDPYQFYYFPNRPHVAVDNGHPVIRLLVYKENLDELPPDKDEVAGFLYFDTTLEWPEETLKKVAKKIQADRDMDRPPRLSPLLYKSGTVRLIFLDKKTAPPGTEPDTPPDPDDDEAPPKEEWVVALESSGVPSLYGDNRAIFSAVLTKKATQLLYGAFNGFIPAGVVYDLSFVAMQRAFNVHVTADWQQVYNFLQESFKLDLFFFSYQTDKIVDELIEKKIIKIEASLEGVGEEGMENEFNAVRKELQEFVLDKFFKPAPNPNKQDPNPVAGQVIDFLAKMRNLGYPSGGFVRRELSFTEIRQIDIDYTVTRAVERHIAPQAHVGVFFEDFGLKKSDVITVVNGDDDFFREVEFNVSANANFDGDGIFGIKVDVAYGQGSVNSTNGEPVSTWATPLNKTQPVFKKSAWFDPTSGRNFKYNYQTIFAPNAIPGPEQMLESGWRQGTGNVLVISPGELYQKRQIEFQFAKNFPYDLYPQAQIEVRYTDPKTLWAFSDSKVIESASPRAIFAFRSRPGAPATVSYRSTFIHSSGPVQGDWLKSDTNLVLVTDPRPHLFRVNVIVAGDRSKIQDLLLGFRYLDLENDVSESKFIRIGKENINQSHEWVFAPADPARNRYEYNQTLLDTDGNILQAGWVGSDKSVLPVGIVYAKRWEVIPELVGPALGDNGLEKVKLSLRYRDERNAVSSDKQMVFARPGKGDSWQLELKDAQARSYTYEISYVQTNGFERKVGPLSSSDTFLMISSVPPV